MDNITIIIYFLSGDNIVFELSKDYNIYHIKKKIINEKNINHNIELYFNNKQIYDYYTIDDLINLQLETTDLKTNDLDISIDLSDIKISIKEFEIQCVITNIVIQNNEIYCRCTNPNHIGSSQFIINKNDLGMICDICTQSCIGNGLLVPSFLIFYDYDDVNNLYTIPQDLKNTLSNNEWNTFYTKIQNITNNKKKFEVSYDKYREILKKEDFELTNNEEKILYYSKFYLFS